MAGPAWAGRKKEYCSLLVWLRSGIVGRDQQAKGMLGKLYVSWMIRCQISFSRGYYFSHFR
jgi:hypothetical protein